MRFPVATSTTFIALLGLSPCPIVKAYYVNDAQTCNANPECAALQLADNCCPTSLAGIFLDCCEQPDASCAANAGCNGLANDCCPTEDETFLYCCFEPDPNTARYRIELNHNGQYWVSTGSLSAHGSPGSPYATFEYQRNEASLYDLIYIKGAVPEAGKYVTGEKKFYINIVATTAPSCTQVMLQFDSIPAAAAHNYPVGRHSRYLGTITPDQTRIEFNFLDRPDENVLDEDVNTVALLFDPGSNSGDTYRFNQLARYVKCDGGDGCEAAPTKSCPALYVKIADGANERKLQEFEPNCSDCRNPACMGVGECSVGPSYDDLVPVPNVKEVTAAPSSQEVAQDPSTQEVESATDSEEVESGPELEEVVSDPISSQVLSNSGGSRISSKLGVILVSFVAFSLMLEY